MHLRPYFLLVFLLVAGCARGQIAAPESGGPIDPDATPETRALFINLKQLAREHILFGHQDDLAYGVNWRAEAGRSDVHETAGAYPAVYGWELGDLELGREQNLDRVNFADMRRWIIEGYRRGGVITIGWHMNNPASGGNAWDTTRAIHAVLPGGSQHETFTQWLDRFVAFNEALTSEAGGPVPIIFRPYHEMTGSWFWWGRDSVTPEEYVRLWRFTVDYLREAGVHNLLYAYSTDVFRTEEQYLEHYPGDEYVDVMGVDDYQALTSDEGVAVLADRLRQLVGMAEARGKIPALTETGLEAIPVARYWTDRLLAAFKADPIAQRIAYVLVWRNANAEHDRPDHYYAPYPGHPSAESFVEMREDPLILFEGDLPDLYRLR